MGARSTRTGKSDTHAVTQAIIDVKEADIAHKWGVAQVRQRVANQGYIVTRRVNILLCNSLNSLVHRDDARQILHDHYDDEFILRLPGHKGQIERVPLDCLGPWHQQHGDGHEKLSDKALNMGDVSLPMYSFKDQFSDFVPILRLLPNVRLEVIIGHLFLDYVEEYGSECT